MFYKIVYNVKELQDFIKGNYHITNVWNFPSCNDEGIVVPVILIEYSIVSVTNYTIT